MRRNLISKGKNGEAYNNVGGQSDCTGRYVLNRQARVQCLSAGLPALTSLAVFIILFISISLCPFMSDLTIGSFDSEVYRY